MKIGALIVTTGLPRISGVAALLSQVGTVTAGQRMISAFQRVGVSLVGLVVGPEDKKAERQFSQNGVVFLRCEKQTDYFRGICRGLSFMREKCDRVFLVPGDTPLFLPQTAEALLDSFANIVAPESSHINGYPILLDKKGMEFILSQKDFETAQRTVRESGLSVETVRVNDSGIMLKCADMTLKKRLIQKHNAQLARPVAEVTLCTGSPLYDARLSMLLHLVDDTRSVRDACSLMQISYSAAWNLLNQVEDELGFPLVTRIRGGSTGSGSVLTEKGRALMDAYDRFSEQLNLAAKELYGKYFAPLPE